MFNRSLWIGLLMALVSAALSGCTRAGMARMVPSVGQSQLAITSKSVQGTTLTGGFESGIYGFDGKHRVTILLYDGTIENPTQAVTIRMFWRPRAGRTPIDPTATNATIHYVIFPGGESVGIYSGAGFVYPTSSVGDGRLSASLWDASLSLSDGTLTFDDLLGKAVMQGKFHAQRDDAGLENAMRSLNAAIRTKIGYPRLVMRN